MCYAVEVVKLTFSLVIVRLPETLPCNQNSKATMLKRCTRIHTFACHIHACNHVPTTHRSKSADGAFELEKN